MALAPASLFLSIVAYSLIFSLVTAAATWSKVPTTGKYRPRSETAFTRCGEDTLCMLGGRGPNYVDVFDTSTLTWTKGVTNPQQIHHFQAVNGPDGCAWAAGAWEGEYPDEITVPDIWRYCPQNDSWSVVDTIERPRGSGGAVLYNGILYLVSGNVGGHNTDASLVPWFDAYDPATGKWTQLPDVPHPRDHFHAAVLNGKLYVVGGRDSTVVDFFTAYEPAVDVYDFSTGEWSSLPDFTRPRGGTTTTVFNGTVVVAAGEGDNRAWDEVDALQEDGVFAALPDMIAPTHGTGLVGCESAMWIGSGSSTQGGGDQNSDTFAFFDGDSPPACSQANVLSSPSPTQDAPPTRPPSTSATATSVPDSPSSSPSISPTSTPSVTSGPSSPPSASSSVSALIRPSSSSSMSDSVENPLQSSTPSSSNSADSQDVIPTGPTKTPSPSVTSSDSESNGTDGEDVGNGESPEESMSEEPSSEPTAPDCFPADATVELSDGSRKKMIHLRIGDVVKVGPETYSPVYFFSHADEGGSSSVIQLEASDVTFVSSAGHLIRTVSGNRAAHQISVGDKIVALRGAKAETVTIEKVTRRVSRGKFNPHTLHGDIVVNDVVASTFTKAIHPVVARGLLSPVRAVYRVIGAHRHLAAFNRVVLNTLHAVYWGRH